MKSARWCWSTDGASFPGDPNTAAADINVIPGALIKRIDVLTGGASSVYGADAVAGVVNFVMDTDFEGFKLDGQYSLYNHDMRNSPQVISALNSRGYGYPGGSSASGGTVDATAVFGAGFDDGRGHVTGYFGYRKIDPVLQAKRDYSACTLGARTTAQVAANGQLYTCGGSATSANGSFIIYDSGGVPANFTSTFFQVGNGRNFLPGNSTYNFAPLNYYQRPDERYTAGVFADYEVSEQLHPYMEFMFMDDRTVAQIAPSGDFGNTSSLNCDNPLLSAQQKSIVCDTENLLVSPAPGDAFTVVGNVAAENAARIARNIGEPILPTTPFNFIDPTTGATYNRGFAQILRRNVEGGARQDDLQHTSYRGVVGVKGDLNPAFSYDAYYQYGRTNFAETYYNDFSITRITRALDVVTGPAGNPVCRSALDGTDPNCVPWDIFAPGGVSQASLAYIQAPGLQRGTNTEQVANVSLTGDFGEYGLKSPFSDEGVKLAIGAEYRKESLNFISDTEFQTGDLAGQGAATLPVSGSFNVKEAFAELRIPLVQDSFIYDASITGGYRYSKYKISSGASFSTDTYKIEGEIAPIRDIRFRGGYNRAVRVPTLQDFFAPQRVVLDGVTDPCSGFTLTAANTGCLAQGLSVGQMVTPNPAAQYNGLIGGNPTLTPEVADTYTAGVVVTPTLIPGLIISGDWFKIKIKNAVQSIGSDAILAACTATADPFFCSLVKRDGSGSLWRTPQGYVLDTTLNIGGASTEGVDITGSYSREVGPGRASISFVGTRLIDQTTDNGIAAPYDCTGYYGPTCTVNGNLNPKWRSQLRVGYDHRSGVGASLRWRYYGHVTQETASSDPSLNGATQPANYRIPSVSYFDLALTAKIGDHYEFRLGANNLLDKQPPLVAGSACAAVFCNGNTYASVYDAIGRYIYTGVQLDF